MKSFSKWLEQQHDPKVLGAAKKVAATQLDNLRKKITSPTSTTTGKDPKFEDELDNTMDAIALAKKLKGIEIDNLQQQQQQRQPGI